ncbi:MAG TPA: DUF4124 domain-containing protein [Rhodanobacteraceae bacterium]|jgi:hypothetical protein
MTIYADFGVRKIGPTLGAMRSDLACVLLLWCVAAGAHAASVYRCVDAHGHLAYQDTPCATHARERKLDLQPQPLIGAPGEHAARAAETTHRRDTTRSRKKSRRTARAKPVTSWECRAADGEVFYRHTRCPGSIPGDGVVRWQDGGDPPSGKRSRHRRNAWGAVPVHGKKITRTEACRRIHSAGAAGRDGHARDETVSTYDHLMGRDPCDNG